MMLDLLLLTLGVSSVIGETTTGSPSPSPETTHIWSWQCVDNKDCVKVNITSVSEPLSYDVCHLVCGNSVLWPYPTGNVALSNNTVPINGHSISFESSSSHRADANPKVQEFIRLNGKLFTEGVLSLVSGFSQGKTTGLSVNIDLQDPSIVDLTLDTDESYTLKIDPSSDGRLKGTITAKNIFGARHGFETLKQLVVFDSMSKHLVMPSHVDISDSPKYKYRGLLLDTARSFISLPIIRKTIDTMSANKLNTFHWHITDSQSFPFHSKTHPKLSAYGAYSEEEVYSDGDMKSIVDYAFVRGIRVVIEFDAPAHVGAGWQWTPENTTVCFGAEPWQSYCVEPPCGQLNPTSDAVYEVLEGIYTDMSDIFKSDVFHMGGDEVNLNCWNSSENVVENMAKMGLGRSHDDFHDLWSHFQMRALEKLDKVTDKNKHVVLWTSSLTSDNIEKYLDKSRYIIQIWTKGNDKTIADLIQKGYRVIFSNYDALYFDCGFGAWVGAGNNWCSPYIPWQTVYDNDPAALVKELGLDENKTKDLVLGAEAALWTEQADDSSVTNRLWPRSAAMAERLWGAKGTWKDAKTRMMYHRKRMVRKGFAPDTLQPEWCDQNDGLCYIN